jgi:hypothetical protein
LPETGETQAGSEEEEEVEAAAEAEVADADAAAALGLLAGGPAFGPGYNLSLGLEMPARGEGWTIGCGGAGGRRCCGMRVRWGEGVLENNEPPPPEFDGDWLMISLLGGEAARRPVGGEAERFRPACCCLRGETSRLRVGETERFRWCWLLGEESRLPADAAASAAGGGEGERDR